MNIDEAKAKVDAVITEIEKVIVGKSDIIQYTVAALLADGHVLFEDMPGVGKTTLARALAQTFTGQFQRIQFTPDLLPSDIVGVSIFNRQTSTFEFQKGPVFTTFLLADEINRATPRTQAALLEAMGEGRVTLDGKTHQLPADFFVLATQNPTDYEGTYPLPEAQLDRFLMRLMIGYPAFDDELSLLTSPDTASHLHSVQPVVSTQELAEMKKLVRQVAVTPALIKYILEIVTATRSDKRVRLGVSPRGALALEQAAKAFALTEGRDYVLPEDIQTLVPLVFGHRLLKNPGERSRPEVILQDIMSSIPAPIKA